MAVTTDVVANGILSSGITAIRTGGGTEHHTAIFRNKGGSEVNLSIYLDGGTEVQATVDLEATGGYCTIEYGLGIGDTFKVEPSLSSVVVWTDIMDNLT